MNRKKLLSILLLTFLSLISFYTLFDFLKINSTGEVWHSVIYIYTALAPIILALIFLPRMAGLSGSIFYLMAIYGFFYFGELGAPGATGGASFIELFLLAFLFLASVSGVLFYLAINFIVKLFSMNQKDV